MDHQEFIDRNTGASVGNLMGLLSSTSSQTSDYLVYPTGSIFETISMFCSWWGLGYRNLRDTCRL